LDRLDYIARQEGRLTVSGVPQGYDAYVAGEAARRRKGPVLLVTLDDAAADAACRAIAFFAPAMTVLPFPAWDCLPYDRVSPKPDIESRRLATLAALAAAPDHPAVIVTTVSAVTQRVPPKAAIARASFAARMGAEVDRDALVAFLAANGYARAGTVREPGDFALRGGIVDLWPPAGIGESQPLRLDFFGSTLDGIRAFDPETQLSEKSALDGITLLPASEAPLDAESIRRFRTGYVAAFGPSGDDPLYESVSAGRKAQGMEHWLPLFYDGLETLFDYLPRSLVLLGHQVEEARVARAELVRDYYETREQFRTGGEAGKIKAAPYKPLKPEALYLDADDWKAALTRHLVRDLTPYQAPESTTSVDAGGRQGRDFAPERQNSGDNVFQAAADHLASLRAAGRRILIASWSDGSAERMGGVMADHGLSPIAKVKDWPEALALHTDAAAIAVLGIEHGFEAPGLAVLSEQDVLGDRMVRAANRARRAQNFLTEASSLTPGDLVTHIEHGVGRYLGLKPIDALGAPHDCLELQYDGGKLFLPVENIELLTRYGSDEGAANLDRLGGAGWQQRKAKMKERVRAIAAELIVLAAARQLRTLPPVEPPAGLYDEFAARFPFAETEDQDRAIADVLADLGAGRPMDRLVCGDVGFGKTEVAMRAAFVAAMGGEQVAVVVPTTLLARQHARAFADRFRGFPLAVRQLSRFVDAKEAAATKAGLADGSVDIVIGTHALLSKSISFKRLGLVIVDEEQHFGVVHKEKLKNLKTDVHVLTLTATPIPRTLQLALTGVRDLSLITTPPVDRLAVRTFVTPFDPLVVREALLREHYRGGQSFFVAPRVSDLGEIMDFLKTVVPEVKAARAHGQMSATVLEEVMTAFYERKIDVLVSTNIVESGLDIPTANTLIVSRADMFGLSQLYQLRGRIGRSKSRAYAYLTTPAERKLTETAARRLEVLQSLDQLGAGFSVASHDMDIRGAGNLLGEEQHGHVREVGIELYQEMLEEAVASMREGGDGETLADDWSPAINLGAAVMIPETYVGDLNVRMSLYRRLSAIESGGEIDSFAAELIDRFGPLPDEVKHLLQIVAIKQLAKAAGVEKIDAGPKGGIIQFRGNAFANPAALIGFIGSHSGTMKVRPDQKLVVTRDWATPEERLKGARALIGQLAKLAEAA
jgi:transcription-repair coupling factor (superfamily II helicase)